MRAPRCSILAAGLLYAAVGEPCLPALTNAPCELLDASSYRCSGGCAVRAQVTGAGGGGGAGGDGASFAVALALPSNSSLQMSLGFGGAESGAGGGATARSMYGEAMTVPAGDSTCQHSTPAVEALTTQL